MRLWSLHPVYLDRTGLVALWREGLLAQKVLRGETRGYRHHPQLERFRNSHDPVEAIGSYLLFIAEHAATRGYRFNTSKICKTAPGTVITVPAGQIDYEFSHLMKKLSLRDPAQFTKNSGTAIIRLHPLFRRTRGGIAPWEKNTP